MDLAPFGIKLFIYKIDLFGKASQLNDAEGYANGP